MQEYRGFEYIKKNGKWVVIYPGGFKAYPSPSMTETQVKSFIDEIIETTK